MPMLADLAQVCVGYTYRGSLKRAASGELAVIQMKDVVPAALARPEQLARVTLPNLAARYLLQPGDLIFRARGMSNQAYVFEHAIPAICIAPLIFIHITQPQRLLPAYLQWFINLRVTQAEIANRARGVAIKMIGVQALATLEIAVPEIAAQAKILEIHQLHQQSEELQQQLTLKRQQYTESALLQFARR